MRRAVALVTPASSTCGPCAARNERKGAGLGDRNVPPRPGAPRLAFESIVASGPNGALPHARPSDRKLGESGEPEFVVFDYGAEVDGYCSDITRTVLVGGEPTPRHREVYEAVLRAQRAALEAIRPGVTGKDVDTVARDLLTQAGLGDRFTHSLGHSLGRVTHDGPAFSQKSELTLAPGMVLTVEPGVLHRGLGRRPHRGRRGRHGNRLRHPDPEHQGAGRPPLSDDDD
jgi:Xaa-Pro aminopeptidase